MYCGMYFGFPRLSKSSEKEKQILSSKSQSICSSSLCSACGPHANLKSRIFEAAALMELLHLSPVASRSWERMKNHQLHLVTDVMAIGNARMEIAKCMNISRVKHYSTLTYTNCKARK